MRKRLDHMLVEKELAASRARARDAIKRGLVSVAGTIVTKAGHLVDSATDVAILDGAGLTYVSRGALKLEAALETFGFSSEGRTCADVGSSAGGFTEVLLQHGARRVVCIDVGSDQLHPRLRCDRRVSVVENQDVRSVTRDEIGGPVGAVVVDVSFISLLKVLPAAMALSGKDAWLIALIKPQFEAGPSGVGKDGVVHDNAIRERVTKTVGDWIERQQGWRTVGLVPSPIQGQSGNQEFLIGAQRHG